MNKTFNDKTINQCNQHNISVLILLCERFPFLFFPTSKRFAFESYYTNSFYVNIHYYYIFLLIKNVNDVIPDHRIYVCNVYVMLYGYGYFNYYFV